MRAKYITAVVAVFLVIVIAFVAWQFYLFNYSEWKVVDAGTKCPIGMMKQEEIVDDISDFMETESIYAYSIHVCEPYLSPVFKILIPDY